MSISTDTLKVPPQDLDAERSVLGAILVDSSAIHLVAEVLRAEYFYRHEHQLIYDAMLVLFEKQQPIDVVTLKNELQHQGNLKAVGGTAYLSDLINAVPTSAYIEIMPELSKTIM
jgi:replicative DNA helicase